MCVKRTGIEECSVGVCEKLVALRRKRLRRYGTEASVAVGIGVRCRDACAAGGRAEASELTKECTAMRKTNEVKLTKSNNVIIFG